MGYVLKSADVGTLFSGRNSDNSSHTHVYTHAYPPTHQHTPVHTRAHLRTPAHTRAHPRTPVHTHAYPRTLAHTRTHPCTPVHTHAHLHTLMHTRAHLHTPTHTCRPHTYPLMPADAFNLINHMKLHVSKWKNGREIER